MDSFNTHACEQRKKKDVKKYLLALLVLASCKAREAVIPRENALVLIDVWDERPLDQYTKEVVNPLIKKARLEGWLIIHAHAKHALNRYIDKQAQDVEVTGLETLNWTLIRFGVQNVAFAGFDALLCVIDKPAGVVTTIKENPSLNIEVLKDALYSKTEESLALGINLLGSIATLTTASQRLSIDLPKIEPIQSSVESSDINGPKTFDGVIVLSNCGEVPDGIRVLSPASLKELEGLNNILLVGDTHDVLFSDLGSIAIYKAKRYQKRPMPKVYSYEASLCGNNIQEIRETYTGRNFAVLE